MSTNLDTEIRIKSHLIQKHDLEVNWNKATGFVPYKGQLIVYDIEVDKDGNTLKDTDGKLLLPEGRTTPYTYERVKIGDGIKTVSNLPFVKQIHPGTGEGAEVFNSIDNIASGNYSHAEGKNTTASGDRSHAEGNNNTTEGAYSHVEGTENYVSGDYAHAEGYGQIVTGSSAHAEGRETEANGDNSHSEGFRTYANGVCAHTEGSETTATGDYAHAEGYYTTASGDYSHAEGYYNTTASGDYSHAEGNGTTASESSAHAEGDGTTASGCEAHAEGWGTVASGMQSHAEGSHTTASGSVSHAEGQDTRTSGQGAHAEGGGTVAEGDYSHAEGAANTVSGMYSHVEGYENIVTINADAAHAEGTLNKASGSYSHVEGVLSESHGSYSHAEGEGTIAVRYAQHVQGKYNIEDDASLNDSLNGSYGNYAHIVGNGTGLESENRSNAHTLDWDGNAWFAGDVYVGCTATTNKNKDDGSKKLATEDFVDNKISAISYPFVSYEEQTLTDEQKLQARTNIDVLGTPNDPRNLTGEDSVYFGENDLAIVATVAGVEYGANGGFESNYIISDDPSKLWEGPAGAWDKHYSEKVIVARNGRSGQIKVPVTPSANNDAVSKQYADTKLDKITSSGNVRFYSISANGTNGVYQVATSPAAVQASYVPLYWGKNSTSQPADTEPVGKGVLVTSSPTKPYHCATKKYVDDNFIAKTAESQTITGNLAITGNLKVQGTTETVDAVTYKIENNVIEFNPNKIHNETWLTGLAINKGLDGETDLGTYGIMYDPSTDAIKLGFGQVSEENKFRFNENESAPIATREEFNDEWEEDEIFVFDKATKKFKHSGKTLSGFKKEIQDEMKAYMAQFVADYIENYMSSETIINPDGTIETNSDILYVNGVVTESEENDGSTILYVEEK